MATGPGVATEAPEGIAVCVDDMGMRHRIGEILEGVAEPVIASAGNVDALIGPNRRVHPACVILAGRRPDNTMGEAAAKVHDAYGDAAIVLVCLRAGAGDVRRAISFGADGVVLERRVDESLGPVVSAVCTGQTCVPSRHRSEVGITVLTTREKQMLELVATGLTNAEIASKLFLAESTVKSHLSSAFGKLNVSSRHEAASLVLDPERAKDLGVVPPLIAASAPA